MALLQQSPTQKPTQIHQLHSAINNTTGILPLPSSFNHHHCWILDTGARDHVFHSHSLFYNINTINMITIKLSNGNTISITKCGTIKFTNEFYLPNVLYIPEFLTNIISIPRIIASLDCTMHFNSTHCTIQVSHTRKTIGTADLHQGLYFLRLPYDYKTKSVLSFDSEHNANCNLWHYRLGHPSHDIADHINKMFPLNNFKHNDIPCDPCFYAKQKRLPLSP